MSKEIPGLIKAVYNEHLIGEDNIPQFGIEIGQEIIDDRGRIIYESFQCIMKYEFYNTEFEAINRANKINSLKTCNWSDIL